MAMSQEVNETVLEQTQQLLDGPLKHIRAAALAAALVPLASVVATPAAAQMPCFSGGVCGVVFNDVNNNGVRDNGDTGLEGVKVYVCLLCDGSDTLETESGPDGTYSIFVPGGETYTISTLIPTGTQASPSNVGDDTHDSDGVPDGHGFSVAAGAETDFATDFGFYAPPVQGPGTGTPGYWKNHSDDWPVSSITIGGVTYTKAQAIYWLGRVGKDKTTTLFASLVSAKLNILAGNAGACVSSTIPLADAWMASHPVGSNVAASSSDWAYAEPLHQTLDAYNNGLLCDHHRT
jgi:hypothetical protein